MHARNLNKSRNLRSKIPSPRKKESGFMVKKSQYISVKICIYIIKALKFLHMHYFLTKKNQLKI